MTKLSSLNGSVLATQNAPYTAYSKTLLGVTIAHNVAPWVLAKVFSLEVAKNDICSGAASKQNVVFSEKVLQKMQFL